MTIKQFDQNLNKYNFKFAYIRHKYEVAIKT